MVMRGSLAEFELPDVLQVVGISRQHTMVALLDDRGSQCGAILMKAGQVLAAAKGQVRGKSAFFRMFQEMPAGFVVFRKPDRSQYPEPLGTLPELLFEVFDQIDDGWEQAAKVITAVKKASAVMEVVLDAEEPKPAATPSARPNPQPAVFRDKTRVAAPPRLDNYVVAVASPKGGVGKTTITLNLGLSLAERGIETVIVDADINGDIMSLIDARDRVKHGVFDLVGQPDRIEEGLCATVSPHLRILPACGPEVPVDNLVREDLSDAWADVIKALGNYGVVTLVDCPAGMLHTTQAVLRSATHVLGVFQAEMIASRSFSMFEQGLQMLPPEQRPELLGVLVNMFQGRVDGSLESFQQICTGRGRNSLFDTTIPRADVFQSASLAGMPLRTTDDDKASSIAWLFDMLAEEICARLSLGRDRRETLSSFLI